MASLLGEIFTDIGKFVEGIPADIAKVIGVVQASESTIASLASELVTLLDDFSLAATADGINLAADAQVASDFMTLLASLKAALGIKGATAAGTVGAALTKGSGS